ncbi:hypothetical protein ACA910_004362 [Epithemia clementina (nom. ined.)]
MPAIKKIRMDEEEQEQEDDESGNNNNSWYDANELAHFREEAHVLSRELRGAFVASTSMCESSQAALVVSSACSSEINLLTNATTVAAAAAAAFVSSPEAELPSLPLPSLPPSSSSGGEAVVRGDHQHQHYQYSTPDSPLAVRYCSMAWNEQTRGLESRVCTERQRRRYLATKCVVRAQSQLSPERLAALSLRCTRWAGELAQQEALRDQERASSCGSSNQDKSSSRRKAAKSTTTNTTCWIAQSPSPSSKRCHARQQQQQQQQRPGKGQQPQSLQPQQLVNDEDDIYQTSRIVRQRLAS